MKKKILAMAMVACIWIMSLAYAVAAGESQPTLSVNDATAGQGSTVKLTIALEQVETAFDTIGIEFKVDDLKSKGITFSQEKSKWLLKDFVMADTRAEQGQAIAALKTATVLNDAVYEVAFEVSDKTEFGRYAVYGEVILKNGDKEVARLNIQTKITVVDGVNLSGTVKSDVFEKYEKDTEVTITLLKDDEVKGTVTTTDGTYSLVGISPDEYVLRVEKAMHGTREYTIDLRENMEKNLEILILGDINKDGSIDALDAAQIYNKINNAVTDLNPAEGTVSEEDLAYLLQIANINGDDDIDALDAAQIYNFINNAKSVYSN